MKELFGSEVFIEAEKLLASLGDKRLELWTLVPPFVGAPLVRDGVTQRKQKGSEMGELHGGS